MTWGGRAPLSVLGAVLLAGLLGGCATRRVVPLPAEGVTLDPARDAVTVEGEGVRVVIRPSAWRGSPAGLDGYVTPFHLVVQNGSSQVLVFDYPDLVLRDDAGFQYTALPPVEVERILRVAGDPGAAVPQVASAAPVRLAAAGEGGAAVVLARRRGHHGFWHGGRYPFWDPWWPWGWPSPYPYGWYPAFPGRLDDVYLRALPVGRVQPGARVEGFAYFPRLRPRASALTLEFHHRLDGSPRRLTAPFGVEGAGRRGVSAGT